MRISWQFVCAAAFLLLFQPAFSASDDQWTFNDDGGTNYILTSVSSAQVYGGTLPANDPALNLIAGRRYGVAVVNPATHPLQIIAIDGSDTVLLSMGATAGSLEGDGTINWTDDGSGNVEFTASQSLLDALTQGGATPGYRCGNHTLAMRGQFNLFGTGTPIADPIGPTIQKGSITIELELIMDGLASPVGVTQPDDTTDRLFITDQVGTVRIVEDGTPLATPFLDVSSRLVTLNPGYDERGLLGFAMHPDFASNPKVYTYTSEPIDGSADFTFTGSSTPSHQSLLAEWQVDGADPNLIDPGTFRPLLRIDQPQGNHNGGAIHFGPDGNLYIALGDGGAADDIGDGHVPEGNGQDPTNIYGSILRIDVDGNDSANGQYGIPAGNPFTAPTDPRVDEIWAYGLRNPYSMSFDQTTGALHAGDVGQGDIEEIDLIEMGGNYGWRLKEGSFFFDPAGFVTTVPIEPLPGDLIDPVAEYDHDEGIAVVFGAQYRGTRMADLVGDLVFGDFSLSGAGRLFYKQGADPIREFRISVSDVPLEGPLKGMGQDRAGEVYACVSQETGPTGTTGRVYRLVQMAQTGLDWWEYE